MGWMVNVIIGQRSSQGTFGANNNSYCRKNKQKGKQHTRRSLLEKHSVRVTLIASKQWNPQSHTSYVPLWYSKKGTHRGKYFKKTQRVCVTLIVFLPSVMFMEKLHFCDDDVRMYIATHLIHTPQLDIQYSRFHGASETCKGDLNIADNHFLSCP